MGSKETAIGVEQQQARRVVHRIATVVERDPACEDPEGLDRLCHLVRSAGHADDAGHPGDVVAQHLGGVPFGVDGDEEDAQLFALRRQFLLPARDLAQGGGADLGAVGEAEEYRRGRALQAGLGKLGAVGRLEPVVALAQAVGQRPVQARLDHLQPEQGGEGQQRQPPGQGEGDTRPRGLRQSHGWVPIVSWPAWSMPASRATMASGSTISPARSKVRVTSTVSPSTRGCLRSMNIT